MNKVEQLSLFEMEPVHVPVTVCLSVGKFAKLLCSRGFNIGERRLFNCLRRWRMLDKFNVPTQEMIEKGYFKVIKQPYKKGQVAHVYLKCLITPIGQKYIESRLADENACNWS